jgi:uncharacterized protein YndB with AHSA1/START domain
MPLHKNSAPQPPVIKFTVVKCSQDKAFALFVMKMDSWWPDKFTVSGMSGGKAKAIRVEAQAGGTITEIGPDGTEHLWGTIKGFAPNDSLSMDFHIPTPGEEVTERSRVDVTYMDLGDGRTRVDLTQSNWEAFGDRAMGLRAGYTGGWTKILDEAFKAKCAKLG